MSTWILPPEALEIIRGQVHCWRADLYVPEAEKDQMVDVLSPDEIERSNRFYFQKDRDQFIASHAFLREVLSRYLQVSPRRIRFKANSHGKPALAEEFQRTSILFNLSHSHQYALVAVTRGLKVGVDVEFVRKDFGGEGIARRFFSPSEVRALFSLPSDEQGEAFFKCWTRKEAYIKAVGQGLSLPLNEFDVSVLPGDPVGLLRIRSDPKEAARWSMFQVDPAPGYCGAVAVEGVSIELSLFDWVYP